MSGQIMGLSELGGLMHAENPNAASQIQAINAAKNAALGQSVGLPYYWEIGDQNGLLVSGSYGLPALDPTVQISIASATKWLFGAYAAQSLTLLESDFPFLNMTSGYVNMNGQCQQNDTVDSCLATGTYDNHSPGYDGIFYYNSGHMEHFASNRLGLGSDHIIALRTAFEAALGVSKIQFTQPLMAGGAFVAPNTYAAFLRKILRGELAIAGLLGSHAVPASLYFGGVVSPAPQLEPWRYSVGHWLEPDGSFSSAGSYGFYPWIDKTKTFYGIVARDDETQSNDTIGIDAVRIGQAIRHAFLRAQ